MFPGMNRPSARRTTSAAALLTAGIALAGCQQQQMAPTVVDPTAITPPGNLLPAAPPGQPGAAAAPLAPGFDGNYAGAMYLVRNPGGSCQGTVEVHGMTVRGNVVHFGQFPATSIGQDGGVQMVEGRLWMSGRFDGRQFTADVTQPMPGCTYQMVLTRS